MPENIIEVRGLVKHFDTVPAVAGVDFEVGSGELFGFLGPNGAGKTTTINLLTGLARPDAGTIRIAGIDCSRNSRAAQHLLGIVPDESNLYPELTAFENLSFCGALYGMSKRERESRASELLDRFGLADVAGRRFGSYSKGMKRKLTIAAGIVHSPPILFLDEPTTGIDVASARRIRQFIADLHAAGTTIFLTTHYIEEAERLCGRIAFIVKGRLVRCDTVDNLLRPVERLHVVQCAVARHDRSLRDALRQAFPELTFPAGTEESIRVESQTPVRIAPLVRFLEDQGVEVFEVRQLHPSLEDVFVQVTGLEAAAMQHEKERAGAGS